MVNAPPATDQIVRVNQQRQFNRRNRVFTPLAITIAEAYNRLLAAGKVTPVPAQPPPNPLPINYNPDQKCIYHSGQVGHDIESCYTLKHRIQDLIESQNVGTIKKLRKVKKSSLERVAFFQGTNDKKIPHLFFAITLAATFGKQNKQEAHQKGIRIS